MTPTQIELVERSFEKVKPISAEAARLFYHRLFELDPSLRPMFRGDMEEQGRKLMQALAFAVGALRNLDRALPAVTELGRRHGSYGVRDEHYATVAIALLWTLGKGLGEAFNEETRDAWIGLYGTLAGAMRQGAEAVAA